MLTAQKRISRRKQGRASALVLPAMLFAAVSGAGTGAVSAAQSCLHEAEQRALYQRLQQTQLMVATLSCRKAVKPALVVTYNRYVIENAEALQQGAPVLRGYLKRAGHKGLDRFLTDLANDVSLEAALQPGFCQAVEAVAQPAFEGAPLALDALPLKADFLDPVMPCRVKGNGAGVRAVD